MTAFACAGICRVDFFGDHIPDWPFHYDVSDIQQVTEEEFRQRFRPEDYEALRQGNRPATGRTMAVYGEIELVNGERIFLELRTPVEPRLPQDQSLLIRHLFDANGLHARRQGGVLIINPTKIVRLAAYPGPIVTPASAWQAHRLPS